MMRNYNIDLIKSIGIVMVIVVHASASAFTLGPTWNAANFYDSISRICVPLFFMCSGALLIGKDEDIISFYKKRALRIIPAIIAWSIIYMVLGGKQITLQSIISIAYGPTEVHLWFIYAMFGLCLLTPFISKVLVNCSNKELCVLYFIWFISSSASPMLASLYNVNIISNYHLYTFSGYIGFMMLGHTLMTVKANRTLMLALFMSSSVAVYYFTDKLSTAAGYPVMLNYEYLSPFVIIASASMFILINNISNISCGKSTIKYLSKISLGIYCSHIIFLTYFLALFNGINIWLYIPAVSAATLVSAFILSFVLSKIPYVRVIA